MNVLKSPFVSYYDYCTTPYKGADEGFDEDGQLDITYFGRSCGLFFAGVVAVASAIAISVLFFDGSASLVELSPLFVIGGLGALHIVAQKIIEWHAENKDCKRRIADYTARVGARKSDEDNGRRLLDGCENRVTERLFPNRVVEATLVIN